MLPWMGDDNRQMPWYWPKSPAEQWRHIQSAALGGGQPEGPAIDPSTLPAVPDVPWLKPKQNLLDRIAGLTPEMAAQFDPASLKSARNAGLLNAGLSLLATGGRTPNYNRANLGQALQMALGQGQDAYGRVLQAAQGLKGAQADKERQQARARIVAKYDLNDPQQAAQLAVELAAFDGDTGALSNAANVYGSMNKPAKAEKPKYVKVETVDANGKPVSRWMTEEDAAKLGDIAQYQKPEGQGGPSGLEAERFNLQKRQADAQNINQALDDYRQNSTTIRAAADGYRSLTKIADEALQGNQAASIGLLYAYAKVLDPASAVREGELATLQKIGSYDRKVANWVEMATKGTLTKDQIRQIRATAEAAVKERKAQNRQLIDAAIERGKTFGVDVTPFIVDPFGGQEAVRKALGDL